MASANLRKPSKSRRAGEASAKTKCANAAARLPYTPGRAAKATRPKSADHLKLSVSIGRCLPTHHLLSRASCLMLCRKQLLLR